VLSAEEKLLNDNGVKSRKFILTILALAILIGMTILCAYMAPLVPLYATFVGGLSAILALYFGGNVAHRYATGKAVGFMETNAEPDQFMLAPQPYAAYQMNPPVAPAIRKEEVGDDPEGEDA
tara:strand:- start:499 stop:864 length:366 start_codon:yes stop_codon:yes gene_type:complete